MDTPAYDVIVVGAGIVGLATAMRVLERHPALRLAVLDKEDRVAAHQTSHNSGVIHAGLYYKPGSLKARLSCEGRDAMRRFAEEHDVPIEICGKVVVALEEREFPQLEAIFERARANGVPGVRLIDGAEIRDIEPHAAGLRAIHSPATGIVDYAAAARAMADEVERRGGTIRTSCAVTGIEEHAAGVHLSTPQGSLMARFLITCTGLQTDRVVGPGQGAEDVRIIPFRGSYYLLRRDRTSLVRGLIYPVPDPSLPFLGVHFTKRVPDGRVMVGPNAIFAFAREIYARNGLNARDAWETLTWPGTWAVVRKFWRNGLWQIEHDLSRTASWKDARRYLPALERSDLESGPTGIRAQTVTRQGALTDDFLFTARPRALHVRNAPSPAATASLAIASHIVGMLEGELGELTTGTYAAFGTLKRAKST